MASFENLGQIIDRIDTDIGSYTDEVSSEARQRVVNTQNGAKGIIVSKNVEDPEKNNKKKGFVVQWLNVGGQTWFPMNELDAVNSNIKLVKPEVLDYLLTLYH